MSKSVIPNLLSIADPLFFKSQAMDAILFWGGNDISVVATDHPAGVCRSPVWNHCPKSILQMGHYRDRHSCQ